MTGRIVPVDAKRADWPRIAANEINRLRKDVDERRALTRAKMRFFYG